MSNECSMNDLSIKEATEQLARWINNHNIQTLNVAGSRQSKDPDIYDKTNEVLKEAIESLH